MGYLLLLVDSASGAVVGVETMTVEEDIDRMREETPSKVFVRLVSSGRRPRAIMVSKPWLRLALAGPCDQMGIQLSHGKRLPALEAARNFLVRSLE